MDCPRHLLDSDEMIVVLARRKPRLDQLVVYDTAERYHAATTAWFDAVFVDLYRPAGPAGCKSGDSVTRESETLPGLEEHETVRGQIWRKTIDLI
jgi:hypothetical protein